MSENNTVIWVTLTKIQIFAWGLKIDTATYLVRNFAGMIEDINGTYRDVYYLQSQLSKVVCN